MTIEDIEKEVIEWHRATFPNATEKAILDKFDEEVIELVNSLMGHGNMVEELADICIVAIALLNRLDTSLAECIRMKMNVNILRKWGPEDETGNRKKESK
jgi:phosphoribosyl-ATP pyrophosphohydrolase